MAVVGRRARAAAARSLLVLVNLLGVAAMAWLGGLLARESGRHALWGLLFAAYFGLVVSVGRDTSEPLADACLLGGLLAYRHRRFVLAALLVGYAVFTNEPVLVLPVVLALTRLWQMFRRRGPAWPPTSRGRSPGFLYVLLQGIQHVVVRGPAGGAADVSANLTWPFTALAAGLDRDVHRMSWTHLGTYDYNLIEFLALMAFVVAGFLVLRSTTAPVHERLAFIGFFLVEVVSASSQFWYSVFGEGRTYIDAYVMAVVLLLADPGRRHRCSGGARVPTGRRTDGARRARRVVSTGCYCPAPPPPHDRTGGSRSHGGLAWARPQGSATACGTALLAGGWARGARTFGPRVRGSMSRRQQRVRPAPPAEGKHGATGDLHAGD